MRQLGTGGSHCVEGFDGVLKAGRGANGLRRRPGAENGMQERMYITIEQREIEGDPFARLDALYVHPPSGHSA